MNSNKDKDNYYRLLERLIKYKYCSNKAYAYFKRQNNYLVIPSILITSFCSISSFLSSSEYLSNNVKNIFILLVGILSSISAMMQTISNNCEYNIKYKAFQKAANSYDDLITSVKFEMDFVNESNFIVNTEQEILKIKKENPYCVPEWINDKYDSNQFIQEKEIQKSRNIKFYHSMDETTNLLDSSII